ncbi:unnamed protein product [Strongylus vulgaris]|uniref:Uncharacterized protein n=1 Tax=Strongylus vulgaris TaxID=40348 RepID=A0A3P7J495_STRVU|nr:unnamed protein product [Strongylus vulgaris]
MWDQLLREAPIEDCSLAICGIAWVLDKAIDGLYTVFIERQNRRNSQNSHMAWQNENHLHCILEDKIAAPEAVCIRLRVELGKA